MNKKVVVFGGGTGITYLLEGLKQFPLSITSVISVSDDGSSTGKLRKEFNIPAIGDIRKVIVSLSNVDSKIKDLLSYRFDTYSDLNGHPVGNLIMVGMYNLTGSLSSSIKTLSDFLNIKHKVLPLSEDNLTLMGKTKSGKIVRGEVGITKEEETIDELFYENDPVVLPDVINAIKDASLIIFSMGSLYTSILPHLLCKSVIKAIDKSNAKIMYTCNAVTQPGETDDYKVSDHVNTINKYLGKRKIDIVIASNTKIPKKIVEKYSNEEQKDLVAVDKDTVKKLGCELICGDILCIKDDMIRHDSLKVANLVFNYLIKF